MGNGSDKGPVIFAWVRDGTTRCSERETFDIRTGACVGRPYDSHAHGDLGAAPDERAFFMTWEIYHPSGNAYLAYRCLPGPPTGVGEPNSIRPIDWGNGGGHISRPGPPGWSVIRRSKRP